MTEVRQINITDVADVFSITFNMLLDNSVLGIPLLVWFVLIAILGLVGVFIKGTKK